MVFAINLPIVYKLRVPNAVSVDTRPTNAPPVLAGNSTLFKAPPVNRPRSTKAATPLCRVRAQMLGYLPEARELVAGELDDERLQNDWDGKDSNVGHFRKLQNNVMTELYGPSPWFRTWIEGEVFADLLEVWITNWYLEVRALKLFPPAGESNAQRATRLADIRRICIAIETLRTRVKTEYRDAFNKAADDATGKASGGKKTRAEQRMKLYKKYKDEDIRCRIPFNTPFASAAEIRRARLVPLQERDPATRRLCWKKRTNKDAVASYIGRGCEIIDIQAMPNDPRFIVMYKWRVCQAADIIHQGIIFPSQQTEFMQKGASDINIRMKSKIPIKISDVYKSLRLLGEKYLALAAAKPNPPTWMDIPVFNQRQVLAVGVGSDEEDGAATTIFHAAN